MDTTAQTICNRLSLRPPQAKSLEILAELAEALTLTKSPDLSAALAEVTKRYPTCTDFEREFPSICFALATGVGKTRLMGAFIAYLHLAKRIKHFFVMAPNLTVYDKLLADLSNPANPKYVFRGIAAFAQNAPRIVSGDNYDQRAMADDLLTSVTINIFNISKLNAETRGGEEPRIKRLRECIGESYFAYLASLPDLVLIMDESHHYRADRGMTVINELKPVLGLELTATPQIERGSRTTKFKNVVYEYSLGAAMADGFVKEPAVATRQNFDPEQYRSSPEELDRIKIEDGVRIHADTRVALEIYARDNNVRLVRPFMLVVAKDTDHAAKLREMVSSRGFFNGDYADKVMEIHSNQTGSEKDENIQQLVNLEGPLNRIEVVIHVNMLKEGWDVTNLYTIVPLRASASQTLTEQTIGRGLRLPYGKRTGNAKVDKLTIVAHDKFQAIIDEANKPDSIIKQRNIITIESMGVDQPKEVVTAVAGPAAALEEEQKRIESMTDEPAKAEAEIHFAVRRAILTAIPAMAPQVKRLEDLKTKQEVRAQLIENVRRQMLGSPVIDMFAEEHMVKVEEAYNAAVEEYTRLTIEIPRMVVQEAGRARAGFHDLDLDSYGLTLQPVSEEIRIQMLRTQTNMVEFIKAKGRIVPDSLENIVVNELMNQPEVSYDDHAALLFKLARQAVTHLRSYLDEDGLINVVQYRKTEIGQFIYSQMMPHFYCEAPGYESTEVRPFTELKPHNYAKNAADRLLDFRITVQPTSDIPTKVFTGFSRACHTMYKFDSKTEKDFAIILEDDREVVMKWLRPALGQFHIYYHHNSRQYNPDFVVEATDGIYIVETKKADEVDDVVVTEKAKAASEYCRHATKFTVANGGKPWKYVLIPHNQVMVNMSFKTLVERFGAK